MNDIIRIHELEVWTHIGIPETERIEEQQLHVTVEIFTDTAPTAKRDDLSDAIDYDTVAKRIHEIAKTERKTLERFTEDIAQMILQEFKPNKVTVTGQKFVIPETKGVSLTITRP
tara:strand:+ start:228 stop:572 length:345 start_codon:yes stop_codon:yes gene_type:complete